MNLLKVFAFNLSILLFAGCRTEPNANDTASLLASGRVTTYECKFANYRGEYDQGMEDNVTVKVQAAGTVKLIDDNGGDQILRRDDSKSNYPSDGYETWASQYYNDIDYTGVLFEREKTSPNSGILLIGDDRYQRFAEFDCEAAQ